MIVVDRDLELLIRRESDPLLTNFEPPTDWQGKDSLVQPCSLDLHIGEIFQPGIKPGKAGSADNPKNELVLRTGQTAVVATRESIHLPSNYAGFGFPPAHISSLALLITNPGHIDPGFSGQLRFTVINMGREDFVLRRDDLIVTLLIFELSGAVSRDYCARREGSTSVPAEQVNIDKLSPDFIDVQKRATYIARKTLGLTTVGAAVLAVVLGWAFNAVDKRLEGIDDMKLRITRLEDENSDLSKNLEITKQNLEQQIDVDHRLTTIESQKEPTAPHK